MLDGETSAALVRHSRHAERFVVEQLSGRTITHSPTRLARTLENLVARTLGRVSDQVCQFGTSFGVAGRSRASGAGSQPPTMVTDVHDLPRREPGAPLARGLPAAPKRPSNRHYEKPATLHQNRSVAARSQCATAPALRRRARSCTSRRTPARSRSASTSYRCPRCGACRASTRSARPAPKPQCVADPPLFADVEVQADARSRRGCRCPLARSSTAVPPRPTAPVRYRLIGMK